MNPKLPSSFLACQRLAAVEVDQTFKHFEDIIMRAALTFVVQLCSILVEPPQTDFLSQQLQKLFQCGTTSLIIVHLLLCALPSLAVQDSHFVLVTQLQFTKNKNIISFNHYNDIWQVFLCINLQCEPVITSFTEYCKTPITPIIHLCRILDSLHSVVFYFLWPLNVRYIWLVPINFSYIHFIYCISFGLPFSHNLNEIL